MTQLLQPHEAAAKVGIGASTLRTWAPRYESFLSEYARRGRRAFTDRDIAVLKAIKAMADEGLTHEAIIARLPALDFPDEAPIADEAPSGDTSVQGAMQLVAVMATSHSAAIADTQQRLTQQDAVIYELRRDLEAVQRALDHALARLEALEGKVGSVGESMHRHSGPVNIWTRSASSVQTGKE